MNKVGLVLSGGGARGFAHVGIIKVLDELGVKPSCVSGCSMGAIIGAFYCLGHSGKETQKKIETLSLKKILKFSLNRKINGEKIEAYFNILFENKNFEDLKIPLFINAVDIETGEEIIFNKGNLAKAVRASMAIPGIFKPIIINKRVLVDGGTKNNIPLQILLDQNLDKIITVNVGPNNTSGTVLEEVKKENSKKKFPHLSKIIVDAISIMYSNEHMIKFSEKNSNLFIVPNLKGYLISDFKKYKNIIRAGEDAAKEHIKDIVRIFKPTHIRNFIKRNLNLKNLKKPIKKGLEDLKKSMSID